MDGDLRGFAAAAILPATFAGPVSAQKWSPLGENFS
jgi:hypothetical protein